MDGGFVLTFRAMGSPCEVRIDTADRALAARLGKMAEDEALRIEHKYSRYRPDSLLSRINASNGTPMTVDPETAELLDYAAQFHALSEGRFDITSGVLRRVWRFDQSDGVPTDAEVAAVLPYVGWDRVTWRRPQITLPPGMEIDFGGLGKEYAVDTTVLKLQAASRAPFLVNFGGDLRVSGPKANGSRWRVAIESVETVSTAEAMLDLARGALTTSGDAQRYLLRDGVRYGHILDPRTGWPVRDPPRSVTVAAPSCMEAGLISTLAMLHGAGAEAFLEAEGVEAWWQR
jgi:FAD:protein FMN transferase